MKEPGHNVDTTIIQNIVEDIVRNRLPDVTIESVNVRRIEVSDDEITLHIVVVFDNDGKTLDPRKTSGMVRHVRPKLYEAGESDFPLFSFVRKSEAKGMASEVA